MKVYFKIKIKLNKQELGINIKVKGKVYAKVGICIS